jgi:photosystem II stability/assembly factor-like uncharacterized protein
MKKLIKVVLFLCFSVGIVSASSPERQEKIKEEQANRMAAIQQTQAISATSAWTPVFVGASGITMKYIDYRPSGVIWALGYDASSDIALYSGDDGASWSRVTLPVTTNGGYANVASASDSVAVVADYDGNILRSADRGKTWKKVYTYANTDTAYFDAVRFINPLTAIAVGDADWLGLHVTKSVDGGATWTRVTTIPDSAKGVQRYFASSTYGQCMQTVGNNVWIAYYSGGSPRRMVAPVIKSTDGGATWTFQEFAGLRGGVNNYYFRSMAFVDANTGFAVGRQINASAPTLTYPLVKTTDGGLTWSDTLSITGGLANNRVYVPYAIPGSQNVFFVGQTGANLGSWMSTDNGATFSSLSAPATAGAFRSIGAKNLANVYAGNVGLFKYQPSVKVTFWANTATVPDTLKPSSIIQVRGGGSQITWGNDTPAKMVNKGGDYWSYSAYFPVGTPIPYKYVTKTADAAGDGWENDITDWGNGNRQLIAGNNDTTIAIEYVNGSANTQKQFWRPYTPSTDSVAVLFRVNMANEENFNKATMKVGVRGGTAPLDWGNTFQLTQEPQHGNGGSRFYDASNFYSGVLKFPKSAVGTQIAYKFYVTDPAGGSLSWEGPIVGVPDNRLFSLPAADTTLYWKFWNNTATKPPAGNDTASVTFTANLLSAVQRNSFKLGDTVLVQFGWGNSAKVITTDTLRRQGITGYLYKSTVNLQVLGTKIDQTGNTPLYYSYYLVRGSNTLKETYYNFNYTGTDNSLAERRIVAVTAKSVAAVDTSVILSNSYRQPFWRNQKQLARNVSVTVTCDLRPAYWQVSKGDTLNDIQGAFTITKAVRDSIWKWGVFINGPMTTGWGTWGATLAADSARKMYDDGTHGDKTAGDRIYTRIINLYKDTTAYTNNTVGQEFKFGIRGGDNEGGKGGFGNNHIENIDDSQPTATLDNQFGSINPKFYNNWNYDTHQAVTGVEKIDAAVPMVYALEQNYPNPFNPSTTIKYSLPNAGKVMLTVFNVLGQEVMTLVNTTQNAGTYTATFDASRLASGMYLYRIEAGSFNAVKKMMLLK